MSKAARNNPEHFDNMLRKRGADVILQSLPERSLDSRILWARAALAANHAQKLQRACQLLVDSSDPLAVGIRAAILSQVGEHAETLEIALPSPIRDRRDHDGMAWLRLARSTAMAALGRPVDALLELGQGITSAELADMRARAQLLKFHARGIQNRLGQGDPEAIEEDLAEPMAAPRRQWHEQHLAEAHLQKGEYRKAALYGNTPGVYHTIALSLRGTELVRHGYRSLDDQAAQTWAAAWHGRPVPRITGLGQKAVGQYARLAYGLELSRTVAGSEMVEGVIGDEPPAQTDLEALWAAVSLQAIGRGAILADPLIVPMVFNQAMHRLRSTDDVLALCSRLMPEAVVVASLGPGVHHEVQLAAHNLMHLRQQPNTEQVVAAYACKDVSSRPKRPPNFGTVLVAVERMIEAASDQQRDSLERHWNSQREALLFDYGSRWRLPGLITGAYHCETGMGQGTLKA